MPPPRSLRIVLLAYEDMNLLDLTGPLQAFASATRRHSAGRPPLYELIVASAEGGLVTSSAGLACMTVPLASLDGSAIDTLLVAGGCAGDTYFAPRALVNWIRQRAPSLRRLASVCTGAFMLAATGLLDGRRVATHWEWAERLRKLHPQIAVDQDKIYVRDGEVWSSAGVSAGIDLALALINDDYGHRVAIETARQMVVFMKRAGGQSQFSAPLAAQARENGKFSDLHAWIAMNLHNDLRVERLAEQAKMSPRSFARSYASETGCTPARTVETMRLEAARRALEETTLPLKAIAGTTGHGTEQNLRRTFQRLLGVSPGEYRQRFSGR
ncbi:GlxA family transcriptional regulator [Duganella sp. Root1480D1]|uniref:GlxA family transcriptional regulator n=1 Tax=Duganella sp. Root1480D1 TaxID=1736471 RepID=UPI00070C5144|nr:GlxA family transcriptional regulator [Duganella sp. Root1480D1]KQZ41473.1 transcriptional regulator [Duganella sp. Root1480D1]